MAKKRGTEISGRHWFAWYTEYPDEGSIVVYDARDEIAAEAIARCELGAADETPISVCEAQPDAIERWRGSRRAHVRIHPESAGAGKSPR